MNIQQYIANVTALFNTGHATEHSYRGDLQQLLQTLLLDVDVTNEPKRIDCGAPDYILSRKAIPVGYIEAKDVGVELGAKIHKAQFDRYKAALDNLIITDYLQFHFYKQGELKASCNIGEVSNGKIFANPQNFDAFTNLIQNFAIQITQSIKSPVKLAQMMAAKAKLMADVIHKALDEDDANNTQSELKSQYEAFKTVLIHDISNAAFADIYAQTIAYGMFAARYHDPTLATFSREEAARLIPQSNPFLRQLFRTVAGYNLDDTDGKRLLWIVEELVQIFLATDVASIMQNFGKTTRQQDPVVHFYETFLAEYDPKLRKARGVWYTPEPVVNFIVRAVDDILKTKFNLSSGLGDTSKTTVKIEVQGAGKKGKTETLSKEIHKVQILDPATGTGTFLAQVVRHIYAKQFANMQGAWPQYVKEHLIPRLSGFELLMTSYAMAHLKLDMLLTETGAYAAAPSLCATPSTTPSLRATPSFRRGIEADGFNSPFLEGVDLRSKDGVVEGVARSDGVVPLETVVKTSQDRLRIYLTNSLENDDAPDLPLFNYLSAEANEANRIKRDAPVMVVIGNPPYSVSSSNKSDWIQNLLVDYKKDLNERNIQPLSDDYIKFIRFGQHFIDKNGEGVLAYISNNSFIDGLIHRQMRKNLLESFDEIYILDLHGNAKKKETAPDGSKDENVFDIMQGVSINLFVKSATSSLATVATTPSLRATPSTTPSLLRKSTPSTTPSLRATPSKEGELKPSASIPLRNEGVARSDGVVPLEGVKVKPLAKVFHHSLYGKREAKYEALNAGAIGSLPWQQLEVKAPEYFFTIKDFSDEVEYKNGFSINELFTVSSSGITTERDHLTISTDDKRLNEIAEKIISMESESFRKTYTPKPDGRDWTIANAKKDIANKNWKITDILYRPFDVQKTIYSGKTKGFLAYPRHEVMQHLLDKENLGFIFKRGFDEDAPPCFISKTIIDRRTWSRPGMQGAESIAPLYTYPNSNDLLAETTRTPNLNMQIVNAIAQGLGLTFTAEKTTTPSLRATPSFRRGIEADGFNSPFLEGVDLRSKDGVVEGVAPSDGVVEAVVKAQIKLNDLPYNPALKEKARELRKAGNLSEVLFWNAVKSKQLNGLDFDRQRVIGNYIVDFYCHECALVVEIDGSSHDDKQEYDAARDLFLKELGLNVLHVQDIEVKKNLSGVIEFVKLSVATPSLRATPSTTPSLRATPSKEGELKPFASIPLRNEGVARSDGVVAGVARSDEVVTFAPIDLLDYIYAVLHSPTYRETYKEFLKIDFPRVPYPKNATIFWQLVALGAELRKTHLLEECSAIRMDSGLQSVSINYPMGGSNVVAKPMFEEASSERPSPQPSPEGRGGKNIVGEGNVIGKVYINATQYFENVPELAWSFYIGGYQPAQKWLKDRKGRTLNHEDIQHYQKMIAALCNTHRLMQAVDEIGVISLD